MMVENSSSGNLAGPGFGIVHEPLGAAVIEDEFHQSGLARPRLAPYPENPLAVLGPPRESSRVVLKIHS